MKLTSKHKIRHLAELSPIIRLDDRFEEKIRSQAIPASIDGVKLKSSSEIEMQHMLMIWNVKDEESLMRATAKAYGLNADKVGKYSLIDYMRLMYECNDIGVKASKMFEKLKRENKDAKVQEIMSKFTAKNPRGIFVEIMKASNGAYTQEQAASLPWTLAYDIIEAQTVEYDKNNAMAELQEQKMKSNGTNKRKY